MSRPLAETNPLEPSNITLLNARNRKADMSQSTALNNLYYRHYYNELMSLNVNTFKWLNMPPEIDLRYLEMSLCNFGSCIFFYEEKFDAYLCLRGTPSTGLNMYGNPTGFEIVANDLYRRSLKISECVPIYNSVMRTGNTDSYDMFARQLADMDRTVDVNLAQMKTASLITATRDTLATVETAMQKVYSNEVSVIELNEIIGPDDIRFINRDAPFVADKVQTAIAQKWNYILTYYGLDNANREKRERLNSMEVESNDEQISIHLLNWLQTRREACKMIEIKFPELVERMGAAPQVVFNTDYISKNFETVNTIKDDGDE